MYNETDRLRWKLEALERRIKQLEFDRTRDHETIKGILGDTMRLDKAIQCVSETDEIRDERARKIRVETLKALEQLELEAK